MADRWRLLAVSSRGLTISLSFLMRAPIPSQGLCLNVLISQRPHYLEGWDFEYKLGGNKHSAHSVAFPSPRSALGFLVGGAGSSLKQDHHFLVKPGKYL